MPDPWKILPIAAGLFQFIQTFMSRPAGQGKPTDPQQAMMNTMMNIMPITVVLFGWTFASGAVLYWVTQSIYGIVQQWFITGWGKLNDYVPNLPEMPEHKRLGYKPPRDLENFDPSTLPPKKQGPLGRWWSKQMEQAQQISEERKGGGAATATAGAASASSAASTAATPRRTTTTTKSERPYSRNSPKGKMLAEQAKREAQAESEIIDADFVAADVVDADISDNGSSNGTPGRSRRAKK